jgi:dTDP-4-dehydrorhamnose reductase
MLSLKYNRMQKVLITGAAGMLGSMVAEHMCRNNDFNVTGTGRSEMQAPFNYIKADLSKEEEVTDLLESVTPDTIVHCAAMVNLNDCEQHKNEAYKIHVEVTKKLASYKRGKCRFIYISTDSVFDGIGGNYSETDKPGPLNYYAKSKLEGEKAAAEANDLSLIIRTNMYGFNKYKSGSSLFEWIYKNLNSRHSITGFSDAVFNPLYTGQLAELIIQLINKNVTGIIHAGCIEKITKLQFALLVADAFELDTSLITNGLSNEMNSIVKRPANTVLNVELMNEQIERPFSITDGIHQLKNDFIQQTVLHG